MAFEQRVKQNYKTGNMEILKLAKSVVDKKSGEVLPIYKTYFESGSQLFKLEISTCKKETKDGNPGMWVKIIKMSKRANNAQTAKF